MSAGQRSFIRWLAGMMVSFVFVYLSYLSLRESFTLSPSVIMGMLALVVLLIYGAESLEKILRSWRGGSD